ncbi:MAG: hypothetical protein ACI8Q1_003261 [Parvicella sp.]|jgi:hypothetical protein
MGIFDDLEIDNGMELVPFEYRLPDYQTKDLDYDISHYRVTKANIFLKVEKSIGKPEKLFHSKDLKQDIGCYNGNKRLTLHVRNGLVQSATLDNDWLENWDGKDSTWDELIQGELVED